MVRSSLTKEFNTSTLNSCAMLTPDDVGITEFVNKIWHA